MGANESRTCLGPSSEDVQRYKELEKQRDEKAHELENELLNKKSLASEIDKVRDELQRFKNENSNAVATIQKLRDAEAEEQKKTDLEKERAKSAELAKFLEEETRRLTDLQMICDEQAKHLAESNRREEAARIETERISRDLDDKERQILLVKSEKQLSETRFADLMKRYVEHGTRIQEAQAIIADKDSALKELKNHIDMLTGQLTQAAGNKDNVQLTEILSQIEQSQKLAQESKEKAQGSALAAFQAAQALRLEEEQKRLRELEEVSKKSADELIRQERELMQKEKDRILREKEAVEQARERARQDLERERESFQVQLGSFKERIERAEQEKEKIRAETEREKEALTSQISREREKIKLEKERLKDLAKASSYETDVSEKPHLTLVQMYSIKMTIQRATGLAADPNKRKRNPYCMVHICHSNVEASQKRATKQASGTTDPVWNQVFGFITEKQPDYLQFDVWDYDEEKKDTGINLGTVVLELAEYCKNNEGHFEDALDLVFKEVQIGKLYVKLDCKIVPQASFRWLGGFSHAEIARVINNAYADVETKDIKVGRTPLSTAVFKNHADLAKVLMLAKANPETTDNEGLTPLLLAAIYGHVEATRVLIEAGANLEARDTNLLTPLMHACKGNHIEVARELIKAGADLESKDAEDLTVLMRTTAESSVETLQLLVEYKANIEACNPNKITALIIAAIRNKPEAARVLLQAGADPNARDVHGLNALMVAAVRSNLEVAKALLEYNADLENADLQFGRTPLMYAAHSGCKEIAELLLDSGASVTALDKDKRTALDIAMDNQHKDVIMLLEKYQPIIAT